MEMDKLKQKAIENVRNRFSICKNRNDDFVFDNFGAEVEALMQFAQSQLTEKDKRIAELEAQIKKMKCCENCGWFYLQQHWRESKEIDESRMFHCGTCGNKKNWKLKEIKENE